MDGSVPASDDLYRLLGVSPDASTETIRHAYRALARRLHPDTGPERDGVAFRRLAAAYEVLGDEDRRLRYDRARVSTPERAPLCGPSAVRRAPGPTGNVATRGPSAVRRPGVTARPDPRPPANARPPRTEADEWRTLSVMTAWLVAAAAVVLLGLGAMALSLWDRGGRPPPVEPQLCQTTDGWVDCRALFGP